MKSVIMTAEQVLEYKHAEFENLSFTQRDIEKKFLIRSAIEIAERNNIECVLVFTKTGKLAKMAAAYRPRCRIYAVTNQKTTFTNTALLFGVISRYMPYEHHSEALEPALNYMIQRGDITKADRVVVVSDQRKHGIEVPMLEIVAVGDLLDNA